MTEIRDHSQMQQNPDSNPETVLRKKNWRNSRNFDYLCQVRRQKLFSSTFHGSP